MIATLLLATVAAAEPAAAPPAAPAAQDRKLRLTAPQMFKLAEVATSKGDSATAKTVYSALEGNPDSDVRAEARFRHAKLLISEKRTRDAAVLLRRVLDDKPDAAPVRLQLAQLLQQMGDSEAALRELRAAQASGLPPSVARMVDRYSEALRANRPLGASFEIAIAPDSNMNHSTRSDTLGTVLGDFQIDEDSKAKSGIGVALRGQAFRRVGLGTSDDSLLIRASGSADLYGRSKFNDLAADVAVGPELRFGRNRLNLELGATQRWFGQKPFVRSLRVAGTWTRPLGTRMQLRLSGSASLVDNQVNELQDGKTFSAQVGLERALSATTGVALTLGGDRQSLKDEGYSTTGWRAGIVGWKDLGRATITASANFGHLWADDRLVLFPEKRSDHYSRFSLGATFRQLTFHGFAPVARFTIERNRSSIEFYDYKRTRSEFAIVRAF